MGKIRLAIGGGAPSREAPLRHSHSDLLAIVARAKFQGGKTIPCAGCRCQHELDHNGLVYCPDLDSDWMVPPTSIGDCYLFMPKAEHTQVAA